MTILCRAGLLCRASGALRQGARALSTAATIPDFYKLDIRIGRIDNVWEHPDAGRLFCEEIDVGEDAPREIASGLREFYSQEELQAQVCLVCCNLKKAKLAGFHSHGMILCAVGEEEKVELLQPPANAEIGERVVIEHEPGEAGMDLVPASPNRVKKKKIFELVAQGLEVDSEGVATFLGRPLLTSKGKCKTRSITNGIVR